MGLLGRLLRRERVPQVRGRIVGWRWWNIDPETGTLKSLFAPTVWSAGWNGSVCHDEGRRNMAASVSRGGKPHDTAAPEAGCSCGFWSAYDPDSLVASCWPTATWGLVELAGQVAVHDRGMRAAKVRPVAVWTWNGDADLLAATYGCPAWKVDDPPFAFGQGPWNLTVRVPAEGAATTMRRLAIDAGVDWLDARHILDLDLD